jgi:hypothetical protein
MHASNAKAQEFKYFPRAPMAYVIRAAAEYSLPWLQWCIAMTGMDLTHDDGDDYFTGVSEPERLLIRAARNGNIACLEWLYEHSDIGTTELIVQAAYAYERTTGNRSVLQFFNIESFPNYASGGGV